MFYSNDVIHRQLRILELSDSSNVAAEQAQKKKICVAVFLLFWFITTMIGIILISVSEKCSDTDICVKTGIGLLIISGILFTMLHLMNEI